MRLEQKKKVLFALIVGAFVLLPLGISNGYLLQFIINMCFFAYLAVSWNILGGYAGQLALGNGVYLGIGAYVSTVLFLYHDISPWFGMLVGALIAGVLSLLLGSITFRLSGTYYALATVALLHVIRMIFLSNETMFGFRTNGALGLQVAWRGESFWNMQFLDKSWYYYIIFGFLALALFISAYIRKSKMGYYFSAISTNPEAASSLGVNVKGMKQTAGFISACLTAMGGTFYAQLILIVDPARILGYDLSVQILVYAIIGGRNTLWGPVAAAFLLSPLNDYLRGALGSSMAGLSIAIYAVILMLIVFYLPAGIWGKIQEVADQLLSGKVRELFQHKGQLKKS